MKNSAAILLTLVTWLVKGCFFFK